ncbi:MAG: hypothetical protein VB048_01110 [Bacteroidaceae bacterium]|nr:hypothetical protein [Bacteroidaceae bacterium]
MKKIFLILITTILFSACVGITTYNNLKNDFSYLKFDNKPNKTNGLFNINGYYKLEKNNKNTVYFMFFEDGSYVNQVFFDEKNNIIGPSVDRGIYKLFGDTIKVQIMFKGVGLTGSSFSEKWYKIIDKNTLKIIYGAQDQVTDDFFAKYYLDEYDIKKYYNSYAKFNPLDSIPHFENELKKDKFFWEDEKDWKEYMDSLKLKKKKNE